MSQTKGFTASRFHDISCGHTVHGHEGKCRHLHGHNYRIHFTCRGQEGSVDQIGRVVDFSVIKNRLCLWVENFWDHRFLVWSLDPRADKLKQMDGTVVIVPFNPTAENMAFYLVENIGPVELDGTGVQLISVTIEETAKCSATYETEIA